MLVLEARQSGKLYLCFAVCLCAEFVQWDVCVYNLLSSPSLAYVLLRYPVFLPLSTQCTTSCGPGYQMRAVKCVVGPYGAVMDDTECNAATRPTETQVRTRSLFFSMPLFVS